MPRPVRASLWLLVCGYVLGLALSPFDPRPWPRIPDRWTFVVALLLGALILWLIVFIALRTYQGRNWARWVQLVTQVAAIPSFVRDLGLHFGAAPIVSSCYALIFMAEVLAVSLLFTPVANQWYRHE